MALQKYTPPAVVKALADDTTMTDEARRLLYVSQPSVDDKATFNQHCTNDHEQSIVLGCFTGARIYLYNVTDPRLPRVKEVTAAHEMLHVAYMRMSSKEKARIDGLLDVQIKAITDQRLHDLIQIYNQTEPGELYNEMHSILGTEKRSVGSELETYYKKYFHDRSKVVAYAEQYEQVFIESQRRIAEYDTRLAKLKADIDLGEQQLDDRQQELQRESARLNQLQQSEPNAYNQQVAGYNQKIQTYNQLLNRTRNLIESYNQLVEERNAEAAANKNLSESLDSRFQTAPQN